jgi:hypothetical protein
VRLVLLSLLTFALPSFAWDLRTDSEGDIVKWSKKVSLVLDVEAGAKLGDRDAEEAIRAAVEHLDENTPHLEVELTLGESRPMGYVVGSKDNQNSIVVLEEWPYAAGTLAVTLVTLNSRTNELLDADIAFNVEEHRFKVLPPNARVEGHLDDVQNTVTHELGHVLGLMHNSMTEDLVMYPSAPPGELAKRVLKGDDRDGLLALYGVETADPTPAPLEPAFGCSATPAMTMILLALLFLARRRQAVPSSTRSDRTVLVTLLMAPAFAIASEPELPRSITQADEVTIVKVQAQRTFVHPSQPGLLLTELTVTPVECLRGACTGARTLVVAGGKLGELEQVAVHQPVPRVDEELITVTRAGRTRPIWVEPEVRARIVRTLRLEPRSPAPQGTTAPRSGPAQVLGIAP